MTSFIRVEERWREREKLRKMLFEKKLSNIRLIWKRCIHAHDNTHTHGNRQSQEEHVYIFQLMDELVQCSPSGMLWRRVRAPRELCNLKYSFDRSAYVHYQLLCDNLPSTVKPIICSEWFCIYYFSEINI